MIKINLLVVFIYFFTFSSSKADCPTRKEIWEGYQKAKNQKKSIIALENMRQICLKCAYQDSTFTKILESIAENYSLENQYSKSIIYINQAIKLNKSRKLDINQSFLESNYYKLANYLNQTGEVKQALIIYDLCILSNKNFPALQQYAASAYAQKANVLMKIGDVEKALEQANIGITFKNNKLNYDGIANCYIEKAKILIRTEKLGEAQQNLDKAIKIINAKTGKTLGYAYFIYAEYFLTQQKFQESINFYKKSQRCYDPLIDRNFSLTYVSIGMIYYYLKNFDKALENFEQALKTEKRPFVKVNILDDVASAYWKKKDFPRAFLNFQKALSAAPIGFKSASLWDNPAVKSLKNADFKQFYLTTLRDKADTWLEYYQITNHKEHLKIALSTYLLADKLVDIMRFEHTGAKSKLFWREKSHSLYEKAIETCFLLKDYEKAFYFFEKSKAVLLNDKLNELSANQQLSAQDLIQEKDFQQQVAELTKKIAANQEFAQNSFNLQNKLAEVETQQKQFIEGLESKNPVYFSYKYDTTLSKMSDVKKYLIDAKNSTGAGSTLIEYFMGDAAIYALKVTPEKTNLLKISLSDYDANAKIFLKYCGDNQIINNNYEDFLKVSNKLYQQLFKSLNPPEGRLIIAQDGFFLPFEALSKSSEKAEYLLQDYAISYTYSVQFLLKNLSRKSFSVGDKFMGMSPVDFNKNLNQTSLSGSDISMEKVRDNFYFGKTFHHQEATKKAFFDNARKYQIVHLYTHAQADSTDKEPMIYFADSVLKLSEISGFQRFKTQLLVLSACKTAVGRNARGEGILSLSRGFATQGIPATLTTLWSVENQATYTLNELFYRFIAQGKTKDVALQQAKIEFLKSQSGEKQLPTFWAAAVLVGDAEAISSNFQWWWILSVIGVALMLIKRQF